MFNCLFNNIFHLQDIFSEQIYVNGLLACAVNFLPRIYTISNEKKNQLKMFAWFAVLFYFWKTILIYWSTMILLCMYIFGFKKEAIKNIMKKPELFFSTTVST